MSDKTPITIRKLLLRGFDPCLSHNCVVKKPLDAGTNSICHCLEDMSRSKLCILTSRLSMIVDKTVNE